jgi:hypothetical protein
MNVGHRLNHVENKSETPNNSYNDFLGGEMGHLTYVGHRFFFCLTLVLFYFIIIH